MRIRIIHPFHPWHGRSFVLDHYVTRGVEKRLVILDDHGLTYTIPITWTDCAMADLCLQIGQGKVKLRADDLLELAIWLEHLHR